MSPAGQDHGSNESVREEAIAWLVRLRSDAALDAHDAFEAWYIADPRHAMIYDELLDNWELTALAARVPSVQARESASRSRRFLLEPLMASAAVFLIAVCVAVAVDRRDPSRSGDLARMTIASATGDIRTVTLPDGSRVTLDTLSRTDIEYSSRQRMLKLERGRARFNVVHERRPFIVVAAGNMVIAHGTMFDVALRTDGMSVALLRGSVEVRRAPRTVSAGTPAGLFLRPGQKVSVSLGAPPSVPVGLRAKETEWPSGIANFEDAALATVVAMANRYSRQQIVLQSDAIGDLRFSGAVRVQDTAGIARLLAASFNLNLSQEAGGIFVLAQRDHPK